MKIFKNLFSKKEPVVAPNSKESNDPWVNVINTNFDGENPKQGFMELEWNKAFIEFLRKHGYTGDSDEDLVDKWFTDLCKNIGGQLDEETKFVADANKLAPADKKRRKTR